MVSRYPVAGTAVVAAILVAASGLASSGSPIRTPQSATAEPKPRCQHLVVDAYDSAVDAFRGVITIDRQSFTFDSTDILTIRTFTLKNYASGVYPIAAIYSFDTAWPRRSTEYAGDWALGTSDYYRLRWPAADRTDPPGTTRLTIAASSEGEIRRLLGEKFAAIPQCATARAGISHTR